MLAAASHNSSESTLVALTQIGRLALASCHHTSEPVVAESCALQNELCSTVMCASLFWGCVFVVGLMKSECVREDVERKGREGVGVGEGGTKGGREEA